jgi:DNA-binding NtrC family response regulator
MSSNQITYPGFTGRTLPESRQDATQHGASDASVVDGDGSILLGDSVAIRRLRSQIQRIAPYYRTALIRGEVGAGKHLVARAIHSLSPGAEGPFVACAQAALTHALAPAPAQQSSGGPTPAGAALLESAQGGTLYLGEIGELPYPLQAPLVRFLRSFAERRAETRRWEVRIVAATHRDLRTMSAIGQFHHELYTRLSAVEIFVPPLRQRLEDLPGLAAWLLRRLAEQTGEGAKTVSGAAVAQLQTRLWPGNLRELERVLAQAATLADGAVIEPRHLLALVEPANAVSAMHGTGRLDRLQDVIQHHVIEVLTRCAGNKLRAAELLGISRSTLYRMLETVEAQEQGLGE